MREKEFLAREERYGAHTYHPLPVVLTRGKGIWLWDIRGKKYLDMLSCYSAINHGHCHPAILKILKEQSTKLAVCSRSFFNDQLGTFLQMLCKLTKLDMAIPLNSGAEAVETVIKAARRWGYRVKNISPNRAEILVVSRNFHGRTGAVISFSSDEQYRRDFGPYMPGFRIIPYGDAAALEKAINPYVCAFLVEPIQGEAGVYIPPDGYLKKAAAICRKHNVLFLVDEIQSGLGRAGKLFAYEYEGVRPDGVILGKSLGGGFLPVSAFIAKKEILSLFEPGSHGSTFAGSPLAAAVGTEALKVLIRDKLVQNSAKLGAYFLKKLQPLKQNPLIADIRGKGLWIGIEMAKPGIARSLCEDLMEEGILAKETHETVIRLAPPLIIQKREIDWALERILKVLV